MTMTALLRSRIPRKGDVRFWRPTAPARVGVEFNYLPFVEREFPELMPRYRQLYRRNSPPGLYADEVQATVRRLKERHGLPASPGPRTKVARARTEPQQLALFP